MSPLDQLLLLDIVEVAIKGFSAAKRFVKLLGILRDNAVWPSHISLKGLPFLNKDMLMDMTDTRAILVCLECATTNGAISKLVNQWPNLQVVLVAPYDSWQECCESLYEDVKGLLIQIKIKASAPCKIKQVVCSTQK